MRNFGETAFIVERAISDMVQAPRLARKIIAAAFAHSATVRATLTACLEDAADACEFVSLDEALDTVASTRELAAYLSEVYG